MGTSFNNCSILQFKMPENVIKSALKILYELFHPIVCPQCDKIWNLKDKIWHQNPLCVASLSGTHTVIKPGLKIVYVWLYSLGPIMWQNLAWKSFTCCFILLQPYSKWLTNLFILLGPLFHTMFSKQSELLWQKPCHD